MKKLLFIIITILVLFSCKENKPQERQQLSFNQNWYFKALNDSTWLQAKVPGVVHLDLLSNKIIPDPYDSTNEVQLQWVGETDWEYKLLFNADTLPKYKNIQLVFEGLDTYADVFLNDSLLIKADNMYRKWTVPLNKHLLKGINKLRIVFYAPEKINNEKAKKLAYTLPDKRAFSRKAPFQFGWDWGAKFLTAGIWKSVYLDCWDDAKISDIQLVQNSLNSAKAQLTARLNIQSSKNMEASIRLFSKDSLIATVDLNLSKGQKYYPVDFEIIQPKMWWCNGMGKANLYHLSFELSTDQTIVDAKTETIGLRTIELVQDKDSIGQSFYFKLNGKPIFIKGANWVPADIFLPRLRKEDYKKLIDDAIDANFNMLRVWGGGIYESNDFYNLCDEKGIMLWQDFMFACTMYPGDTAFVNNVKQEAIDNVIRLRNHASLALWCGNNEVDNGWKDWGWQKQYAYSDKDSTEIWHNYLQVFEELLPQVVKQYDGTRQYHPSSPTYGWGHPENFTIGDSHYWGVWWGHEPFSIFKTKVGRFMSEYGFQALPNINSIKQFTDESELFIASPTLKAHQKHPTGYQTIDEYLQRSYKTNSNFEDYIYLSQLTQAEGITTAIEAHRRVKPYCMGTLYWQFNDAWPVTSWSSTDYYGRRKALHYFVKQAYKPTIISVAESEDSLDLYIISDTKITDSLSLKVIYLDYYGNIHESRDFICFNSEANSDFKTQIFRIANCTGKEFLYLKLFNRDSLLDNAFYYTVSPKALELPKANIKIKIETHKNYTSIILHSDVLAKNVELIANFEGDFSDNYFDMLPNVKKEVIFKSSEKVKLKINYHCLNNIYK